MFGNILTVALAVLATSAVAQPHNHGNMHRRHAELHRRHAAPKVVTEQNTVATVYVDQHGKSIASDAPRTVYVTVTAPAPTASKVCCTAPALAPEPVAPSVAPVPEPEPEVKPSVAPAPEPAPSSQAPVPEAPAPAPTTTAAPEPKPEPTTSTPAPASSAPARSSSNYTPGTYPSTGRRGITYSPYDDNHQCKTPEKVAEELALIQNFSPLRLYGVDCQQIENVIAAGKKYNQQIFAGVWATDPVENLKEINTLIEKVGGQWDSVHTISIGNEAVNFGRLAKDSNTIIELVDTARQTLRAAGYNGPVVLADTFVAIKENPAICQASDYIAANCHPFFAGRPASEAAQYLKEEKEGIAAACGSDKEIVITEVGWPTGGTNIGEAFPGEKEQAEAIRLIAESEGDKIVLFSAFDEKWKKDTEATHGTEKHWGIKNLSEL